MFKFQKVIEKNIVFIGPPRSGKSSLINRLIGVELLPVADNVVDATRCPIEVQHDTETSGIVVEVVTESGTSHFPFENTYDARACILAMYRMAKTSLVKIKVKGCFPKWGRSTKLIDTPSDVDMKKRNAGLLMSPTMVIFVYNAVDVRTPESILIMSDIASDCFLGVNFGIVITRSACAIADLLALKTQTEEEAMTALKKDVAERHTDRVCTYDMDCVITKVRLVKMKKFMIDNMVTHVRVVNAEFVALKDHISSGGL